MTSWCWKGRPPLGERGRWEHMGTGSSTARGVRGHVDNRGSVGQRPVGQPHPPGSSSHPTPALPGSQPRFTQTPRGQGLLHFSSFAAQNRKSQNIGLSLS